jgi:hypothetical protein
MSMILIKNNSETIDKNEYLDKPIDNGINDDCKYCILSLLIKQNKRKDSVKTNASYSQKIDFYNYKYEITKKFDEFNKSLSDISEFDLDGKEELSFYNSSEEDNVIEEEVIRHKSKKRLSTIKYKDDDFENEIEDEFKELLKQLKVKKN